MSEPKKVTIGVLMGQAIAEGKDTCDCPGCTARRAFVAALKAEAKIDAVKPKASEPMTSHEEAIQRADKIMAERKSIVENAVPAPADIKIGASSFEARGNHIHVILEENHELSTKVLVVEGDGVEEVESDDGKSGIRFTAAAFEELCMFIRQVH